MEIKISINGVQAEAKSNSEQVTPELAAVSDDAGAAVAVQSNGYNHTEEEPMSMVDIGAPPEWLLEGIRNSETDRMPDAPDEDVEDAGSGPTE